MGEPALKYDPDQILEYKLIPTIKNFHECGAQIRAIVGPVGCYSGDTEFLTLSGWVRFDQYNLNMEVAQWDSTSKFISFVSPEMYIKEPCSEFIYFYNQYSLSMMLSEEHRMPLYDYRGAFKIKQAIDVEAALSRYTVPTTFRVAYSDYLISDADLRVMVMFNADGSINPAGNKQRIVVRKDRKHIRIKQLLGRAGIEYTIHPAKDRPTEIGYAFVPPVQSKRYDGWYWNLSERQLKIVVDELQYWDGLFEGDDYRFTSINKKDADFIQYAVHAIGGRATISTDIYDNTNWYNVYIVHIALPGSYKSKVMLRSDTCSTTRVLSTDGFKYCFKVPTGFLVVRHNGKVFISGNSGKTSGASWETQRYIPFFLFKRYGIRKTCGVVVRNTYSELIDTTQKTLFEWFPWGNYESGRKVYTLKWDAPDGGEPIEIETLFRSCDRPEDVKKFKSLELTWYWVDESIEVADEIKRMLKNRIGRYPRKSPVRFGIETTNPPDVEHITYSQFKWATPPPGPVPTGVPLAKHVGFWQPPFENVDNLRPGYYKDLMADYADNPDWVEMYIKGMPGQLIRGKLVYQNFLRDYHVANAPLRWNGQDLYRGWDNSGNTPACIVVSPVTAQQLHVFKEFTTVRENIVDFGNRVKVECNVAFPNAKWIDYGDPAGKAKFSTKEGTFTSNVTLMNDECGIYVISGEQNFKIRVNVVDQALLKRNGILIDPSCIRLINGFLGGYHYPELQNMPGSFKKEPAKNKYSHIHDSLQYVLTRLHVSAAPPVSDQDIYPELLEEPTY